MGQANRVLQGQENKLWSHETIRTKQACGRDSKEARGTWADGLHQLAEAVGGFASGICTKLLRLCHPSLSPWDKNASDSPSHWQEVCLSSSPTASLPPILPHLRETTTSICCPPGWSHLPGTSVRPISQTSTLRQTPCGSSSGHLLTRSQESCRKPSV